MDDLNSSDSQSNSSGKSVLIIFWIISLACVAFVSFAIGKNSYQAPQNQIPNQVLAVTSAPTKSPAQPTVTLAQEQVCQKSGLAQKWEYLDSYTMQEGDSLHNVVNEKLGDISRINEVIQLNVGGSYQVAGATLYLPPKSVSKSSGNLKEVSGKLLSKNKTHWQLAFGLDESGPGITIPSYWFSDVTNSNEINIGDCITVLFDDGFKVFTVNPQ